MRRVTSTLYSIFAIIFIVFLMVQAQDMGAPWIFTAAGIIMIMIVVINTIRVLLRGY